MENIFSSVADGKTVMLRGGEKEDIDVLDACFNGGIRSGVRCICPAEFTGKDVTLQLC